MCKMFLLFALVLSVAFSLHAPDTFDVTFATTVKNQTTGTINLHVERKWSPNGVDRFYTLLKLTPPYYNQNGFFRVVPGFVVQFGISGDPKVAQKWEQANIVDDPVVLSNLKGTVAYADAGPNTRSTQLFINYADNTFLDSQGFTPFAKVSDDASMKTALSINSLYGQTPDQNAIYEQGNTYLKAKFPLLDYITTATISNEVFYN
eukprot:TRINITY_DN16739_c0_g1_i1.p1 TRINITY_DN16739_c0_g1~~TRINITY_DN16739_c0_g1_i1.p1  ORF type:complete len:205 (-),score=52.88 TRINITY_DN16739_c0_g1_i1:103-717(-)